MSRYLVGILSELVNPIVHAWSNILDSYFSNEIFQKLSSLIFFTSSINILFLPIVLFFGMPAMLPGNILIIVFLISAFEIAFQYPYYWSLRSSDTSVVASLFSLGKIFVPILAFLVVGEKLGGLQYIGFAIIVTSSVMLTFDPKRFRVNRAFFSMMLVCLILAFQAVSYKYVFNQEASWPSVVFWETGFEFLIAACTVLFFARNRRDFKSSLSKAKGLGPLFLLNQFLAWSGNVSDSFAISLIPVTVGRAISGLQPLFVLLYAALFAKKMPRLFKENVDSKGIVKKIVLYSLIIAGTVLVVV